MRGGAGQGGAEGGGARTGGAARRGARTPRSRDLEALRRRLYAPDASPADVARYRDAAPGASVRAAAAAEQDGGRSPRAVAGSRAVLPRRRAARAASVAVATAVLLVAAAAVGALAPGLRTTEPRAASSAASPSPVAPRLSQQTLTVPGAVRAMFADALRQGRGAAVGRYLVAHEAARPDALRGVTRIEGDERWGTGPGEVRLDPTSAAGSSGRVTVVLVLDRAAVAGYDLSRPAAREDHRGFRRVVADGSLSVQPGRPVATTFAYTGAAPTRLAVVVPPGVRWDAVVVLTD